MPPPTSNDNVILPQRTYLLINIATRQSLIPTRIPTLRTTIRSFLTQLNDIRPTLAITIVSNLTRNNSQLITHHTLTHNVPIITILPLTVSSCQASYSSRRSTIRLSTLLRHSRIVRLPLTRNGSTRSMQQPNPTHSHRCTRLNIFISSRYRILLTL